MVVAVTAYVVVVDGITVIGFVVEELLHKKLVPFGILLTLISVESPKQIADGTAVNIGKTSGLIYTVTVAVPIQPPVVVPVTVYVVFTVGLTLCVFVVVAPFDHV